MELHLTRVNMIIKVITVIGLIRMISVSRMVTLSFGSELENEVRRENADTQ